MSIWVITTYSHTCVEDHLQTKTTIAKPACKDHQFYLHSEFFQWSLIC